MVVRVALLAVSEVEPDGVSDSLLDMLIEMVRRSVPHALPVVRQRVVSERYLIEEILRRWADEEEMDLIITVGGTFPAPGLSGDEIVPEATQSVLERTMPSLPETMRAYAMVETPMAILDRGQAGIRARSLVLNLPGRTDLAELFLEGIADVLAPILDRLQSGGRPLPERRVAAVEATSDKAGDETVYQDDESPKGLTAEEFEAFLRSRRDEP